MENERVSALGELPRLLRKMLEEAAPEWRNLRPQEDAFSLTEQICHLRDLEQQGYVVRIRRMLQEELPELTEFDGKKVAQQSNYHSQDPSAALSTFDAARAESIALLSRLSKEQMERRGRFGTFGMITIEQLLDMMLEHDRSHTAELEELRASWPAR